MTEEEEKLLKFKATQDVLTGTARSVIMKTLRPVIYEQILLSTDGSGLLEMAFHVDKKPLVVDVLRELIMELESGKDY